MKEEEEEEEEEGKVGTGWTFSFSYFFCFPPREGEGADDRGGARASIPPGAKSTCVSV